MAKTIQARMLVDYKGGAINVKAGAVMQGTASQIDQLTSGGVADSTKEAVAYALSQCAEVVDISEAEPVADKTTE